MKSKLTNITNMIMAVDNDKEDAVQKLKVTYGRRFGDVGRRYANGPSFQKAGTLVRATSKRWYYDIDMMNAHPVIVAFLVTQMNLEAEYPHLVLYGNAPQHNREKILDLVTQNWQCSRKVAKQLFCSLINTGTVNGWQIRSGLLEVAPVHRPSFVIAYEMESARFIQ